MVCPQCGFENTDASTYCERCGALQQVAEHASDQQEYKASPPPPLNGHNKIPIPSPPSTNIAVTPPPLEFDIGSQTQVFANSKISDRPRVGIFSGILYFIGILLASFGLVGIFASFGTGTLLKGTALLIGIAALSTGIAVFILIRQRFTRFQWWQRILWILAATGGAFVALIIEVLVSSNSTVTNYFTGCIIVLYAIMWASISVW